MSKAAGTACETVPAQPKVPSLQVEPDSSIKPEETNREAQAPDPLEPQDSPKRKVAFRCKICEKQFPRLQESQNHLAALHRINFRMRSIELQVRERSAQTRDRNFQTMNLEIRRMRPFACPICDKTFVRKYTLFLHLDKTHTGSRSLIQCPICVEEFTREPLLKAHYEKVHSDPRPEPEPPNILPAELVPARKVRSWNYSHLAHGYNFYKCHQCDLKFSTATLREAHSRSLNEAGQRSEGRTHLRVYRVGGLLEACPICPCMFLTKEAFRLHVRVLHPEAELPCANCSERFKDIMLLEDHRSKVHLHDGYVEDVNGKKEFSPTLDTIKTEVKDEPSSMDLILGI